MMGLEPLSELILREKKKLNQNLNQEKIEKIEKVCDLCLGGEWIYYINGQEQIYTHNDIWKIETNDTITSTNKCPKCNLKTREEGSITIPQMYEHCTFDSYNIQRGFISSSQKYIYSILTDFLKNFNKESLGWILSGPSGVGKSHLLISFLRSLTKKNYKCVIITEEQLLLSIKNHPDYKIGGTRQALNSYYNKYDVIGLIRIGTVPANWDRDVLASCYISLYELNKWKIFGTSYYSETSEIKLEDRIERGTIYHVGVNSKLKALCPKVLKIDGVDYREYQRNNI